ncbi:MAG: thioredoxin-dependent thiol peroxidase [Candidatus Binataceae bacterium]|nr:thioredoxin-dependent thiol peroxidase [Candidatus Binataceae bacterium]
MPSKPVSPGAKAQRPTVKPAAAIKPPVKSAKVATPVAKVKRVGKPTAQAKPPPKSPSASGHELEGRRAPAFVLPDQDGAPVALASLTARGPVVLYFYPKDMTPGCTVEACGFRDHLAPIRALGAMVVGVSADKAESHRKFIARHSLNFPLLSDTENKVTRAYGVYTTKSLYGREFMGIVRTTVIIGADGMVKQVFPKVKVNGHITEVVAALKELR